jgi:hypothetical protein
MDKIAYVDKRRRKYLAQLMEAFEELIEPQTTNPESVATFKGLVRAKMNALAVDAIDVMNLRGRGDQRLRDRDDRSAVPERAAPLRKQGAESMSVHAGSILTVGGNNVIDRIQSAGLGDVNLPIETIREVGNRLVVDKIPASPTSRSRWSRSTSPPTSWPGCAARSARSPPAPRPARPTPAAPSTSGTTAAYVNVVSPWKDPNDGLRGHIEAGHLIPATTRRGSTTASASPTTPQTVELGGGTFYYGAYAPVEEYAPATGGRPPS